MPPQACDHCASLTTFVTICPACGEPPVKPRWHGTAAAAFTLAVCCAVNFSTSTTVMVWRAAATSHRWTCHAGPPGRQAEATVHTRAVAGEKILWPLGEEGAAFEGARTGAGMVC